MSSGIELANRGFRVGCKTDASPFSLKFACDSDGDATRSFYYNNQPSPNSDQTPAKLFEGDVAVLSKMCDREDKLYDVAAAKLVLDTDLLVVEPPCQNYSGKNRSTDRFRHDDHHPNIKALWDSLRLWSQILPMGLNFENVVADVF
jgi:site-specific DNA-cytosine methylase